MSEVLKKISSIFSSKDLAGPIIIILVLAMMVLPLPPILLDLFFTFNIGVSLIVLLTAMRAQRALDFLSFPTVLLLTTLLRLSLNVASTRAVLMEGHTGPDAAGKVIEAFASFLIGGNYAVGIIVFIVLTIINFVVITKGATRIAEVAARFTLDAMPGKQMAIDADLNAGIIKEEEAKQRRAEVSQEAEFYGSMDGASKFVRGDAVAAILILSINLIGGLIIGVIQHGMDIANAASNYTLLAIGDGLVAQVPGIMISTAAGVMVSRVSAGEDISKQMAKNLLNDHKSLFITASIIFALGMIPGMPHFAFILISSGIFALAKYLMDKNNEKDESPSVDIRSKIEPVDIEVSWDDAPTPDTLSVEIGYRLIVLTENGSDNDILKRIKNVRKKFTQEIGFLPSPVQIRDNLEISPNKYRILFKGVEIGVGEIFPEKLMAIHGEDEVLSPIPGQITKDPTFGMPAIWISSDAKRQAEFSGYAVIEPGTVLATHLSHIMKTNASELLGREEVQALVENLKRFTPKLIEDVIPKLVPLHTLQRILQLLLSEGVSITDVKTVIEVLAEHYGSTQDNSELLKVVRVALGRSIVSQFAGSAEIIPAMTLSPKLENLLMQAFSTGGAFDPKMAENLMKEVSRTAQIIEDDGGVPVLIVPAQIRGSLARFLRKSAKDLNVLAVEEIPDGRQIKITHLVGDA